MALGDIIAKLLEMLGLKKTQKDKYAAMEQKLRTEKASDIDQLEQLKDRILISERKAKQKKKEYDSATGTTKEIVANEIERIFKDLDRDKNLNTIISSKLDKYDLAIAKLRELAAARTKGLEDVMDTLAVELEDVIADLKNLDRVENDLNNVAYNPNKKTQANIESRMSELEVQAQPKEALSESSAKRLKELANEEE